MTYIEFQDKGFERAVKTVLNRSEGNIKKDDLLQIKGICVDNEPRKGFSIPWHATSTAFGMNFPELIFDIHDSENDKWQEDLQQFSHIKSFHLYVPTNDLHFLKRFDRLKELYIVGSFNKDWSFLAEFVFDNLDLSHF